MNERQSPATAAVVFFSVGGMCLSWWTMVFASLVGNHDLARLCLIVFVVSLFALWSHDRCRD